MDGYNFTQSDWYNSFNLVNNYKWFCIFFAYVQYNSFKEVEKLNQMWIGILQCPNSWQIRKCTNEW